MSAPYKRIHVVINPASGKDEPIINVLNDVFHPYDVDWEVSITKKYGDATEQAKEAIARGVDLVAGYGGDGTQHEVANAVLSTGAVLGTDTVMGVLPGGTGNGYANEMNIPKTLKPAVEVLCTSQNIRKVDATRVGDQYFIQRMYVGVEPEEQTSREQKDRYGLLAYAVTVSKQIVQAKEVEFILTIDGERIEQKGFKCYVVNSGKMGTGLSIDREFSVTDGLLDVFMLGRDRRSIRAAHDRFFHLPTEKAGFYYWRGREIKIEVEPSKAVWTDGELFGRTPVTMKVLPGALSVLVPEND
jgi:YegS/Rv2252/BmrU family lipid kinase